MQCIVVLHQLSDFINCNSPVNDAPPSYYYEGHCLQTGELLRLPRTLLAETIASGLMLHLAKNDLDNREGKMYGVLLVELSTGEQRVIKAFSGLLNGQSVVEGWVPPIPGRDDVASAEAYALAELEAIKLELIKLQQLPERQQYITLSGEFEQQWQAMSDRHRDCKHQRQQQRQLLCETLSPPALTIALEALDAASRQQGIERRQFKHQRDLMLQPLQQLLSVTDARILELKQRRKAVSRQLQAQMHAAYSLMNFLGQSLSLQQLIPEGSMPTGTGDCCAIKLLHYAATHNFKPLAIAEFWWGTSSANQDKIQGEFYGACVERCQPLMGFLLSGLRKRQGGSPSPIGDAARTTSLSPRGAREIVQMGIRSHTPPSPCPLPPASLGEIPILYADEWLIAVNKPPGLLSVPGRYHDRQDSVLSRLCCMLPDGANLATVHRLDQETSGILLLARDRQTHRHLSLQFQQRLVNKIYEAILAGDVKSDHGTIELPLWGDPQNRPYQQVDWQRGKPSLTSFQVMARAENYTRVELIPSTGRTHQLRVHAADAQGLGVTILGDRLYGCRRVTSRLHLHARELSFQHPQSGNVLHLQAQTPF